jgi:WD40 repeat protein
LDNNTLASTNGDATLRLWDVRPIKQKSTSITLRELKTLKGHSDEVRSLAVSSDGKTIITGSADTMVKLWNVNAPPNPASLGSHQAQSMETNTNGTATQHGILVVAFSPRPGDAIIASGSTDGTLTLWKSREKQKVGSFKIHPNPITALAFSPDGQVIASGSESKFVLSDTSGKPIAQFEDQGATSIAFSPDGKTLATGRTDGKVELRYASNGVAWKTLPSKGKSASSIAFSRDGKFLAVSGMGPIMIWDSSTWTVITELTKHTNQVLSLAFSPDGRFLASASADNTAVVWDVNSGFTSLATLGHRNAVLSLAFSQDGNRLITGCFDGTVKFWDTGTTSWVSVGQQELATLRNGAGDLLAMAFSPDETMIATGGYDFIELWNAPSNEQINIQR